MTNEKSNSYDLETQEKNETQNHKGQLLIENFLEYMPRYEFQYHINISLVNSYIYFEVPKVACSTIKGILQEIECKSRGIPIPEKNLETIHNRKISPLLTPKDIGFDKFIEMLKDKNIFKFGFVRNPFDRVLSAYLNKINNNSGPEKKNITDILGLDITDKISFDDFVYAIEKTEKPFLMNPHWRPQSNQLFYDLVKYDFIGKIENFDNDFRKVLEKINPEFKFNSENYSDKTDASKKLLNYYNDKNKSVIKKIYSQDFKNFNYPEF